MLSPATEAEVVEAVAGATGPLRIVGGGTRTIGNPVVGEVLSVARVTGVELHEPGALTLVVRAGTPLAEIEALLAAEGQRLAFEPPDLRGLLGTAGASTIGGVMAANAAGPRRVQAGAARDAALGVRFVDGRGTVVRNGGRVMKNVTGYDLVKLLSGSRGTLGVLTEVALKVLPVPETQATLQLPAIATATDAVTAMSAALGSPFDVSGAAHLPGTGTLLRLEGFADSVADRARRLAAALARFGDIVVEADAARSAALWAGVRDVARFHGTDGDVWRLSLRPGTAAGVLDRLAHGACLRDWMLDWGGGLVWVRVPPGTDLRAQAGAMEGHATLVRTAGGVSGGAAGTAGAPGSLPGGRVAAFPPEAPAVAALSRALRARFDPRGILNPGLMDAV